MANGNMQKNIKMQLSDNNKNFVTELNKQAYNNGYPF